MVSHCENATVDLTEPLCTCLALVRSQLSAHHSSDYDAPSTFYESKVNHFDSQFMVAGACVETGDWSSAVAIGVASSPAASNV